ncbi:DMSO/TMAO reductase YedYZ molybdopterin-dependent catalytic subunit [Marmoricola sp. OAE513]|uniref:molybdopterin-dependent oxidoreductase n=1 Tax=Marmoricola sp. OAE513 TaxID=2817894 RepID=UPI001AE31D21
MKRTTPYLALAGLLTGAAGIVTAQSTAWLLQAGAGPVRAARTTAVDLTPGVVMRWLVSKTSSVGLPLGNIMVIILLLVVFAVVGVLALRRPLVADVVYVATAGIGVVSALRIDRSIESAMCPVVAMVTWIVVSRLLVRTVGRSLAPDEVDPSRRQLLGFFSGVVLVTAGVGVAGLSSRSKRNAVDRSRRLLRLPITRGSVPAGSRLGVVGISSWRTPARSFYKVRASISDPVIEIDDWTLRVHGMVDREVELSYSDLVNLPMIEAWVTMCAATNEVGGEKVGNAYWSGIRLGDILEQAGVQAAADTVVQTGKDGWTCAVPLDLLTDGRTAMLALAMNGAVLEVGQGFPARTVVAGVYDYATTTKWVVDLEVTTAEEASTRSAEEGWDEGSPVRTQSRIDLPRDGDDVPSGTLEIGGVAWSPHAGIRAVEYQLDGGPWVTARVGTTTRTGDAWVQWTADLEVGTGAHVLVVRATDMTGVVQTDVENAAEPSGATGLHQIDFDVV